VLQHVIAAAARRSTSGAGSGRPATRRGVAPDLKIAPGLVVVLLEVGLAGVGRQYMVRNLQRRRGDATRGARAVDHGPRAVSFRTARRQPQGSAEEPPGAGPDTRGRAPLGQVATPSTTGGLSSKSGKDARDELHPVIGSIVEGATRNGGRRDGSGPRGPPLVPAGNSDRDQHIVDLSIVVLEPVERAEVPDGSLSGCERYETYRFRVRVLPARALCATASIWEPLHTSTGGDESQRR